jgi:hypothetical protein
MFGAFTLVFAVVSPVAAAADQTGSYTGTFVLLMVLCFVGAIAIYLCRRPAGH